MLCLGALSNRQSFISTIVECMKGYDMVYLAGAAEVLVSVELSAEHKQKVSLE